MPEGSRGSVGGDLADRLPAPTNNVLALSGSHDGCVDVLSAASPDHGARLVVTAAGSVDEWVDRWESRTSMPLNRTAFVTVGDGVRSASASTTRTERITLPDARTSITAVPNPDDLAEVGTGIVDCLDDLADHDVACCVDSLAPFVDDDALERGFRVLHVITHRVAAVDAVACYRLDPDAHDRETIRTIEPLFDAVVDRDGDEWRVRA